MNNDDLNRDSSNNSASEGLRTGFNHSTGGSWKMRTVPVLRSTSKNNNQIVTNKLGNNRLNQKVANQNNHQRPDLGVQSKDEQNKANNPKSGDIGSRNLQKSLSNKATKIWNSRKKKKKEEDNSSSDDNDNNSDDTSSVSLTDDLVAKSKRKIKIKIIVYTSIIGLIILMFAIIIMAILGVDISATIPAINQGTYGTDKFTPTYEESSKEYKQEINYYDKLKEASEKYAKENGEEIKAGYIHAALIYLYYQIDEYDVDNIPVDYGKMTNMIDKMVELIKPADPNKTIDYEKKGEFYNKLKESTEFKNYYKDVLKNIKIDDLLDEIFNLAEELDELENEDNTVITTETKIVVPTTTSNETPKKMTINDYLANSIYAKASSIDNDELIKAYTIAYSTNIASQNKNLTIDSNNASMTNQICSTKEGCSYDEDGKLVDGKGEQSDKNTIYYNGGYYYRVPLTTEEEKALNKTINSVFGNVLVKSDGTYPDLDINKIVGLGDYKTILNNGYGDYTIKNIGENSYILDASYGDKKVLVDVKFYDQSSYSGYSFCGIKKETIASSGCGITAMAIVTSTYENDTKYDPVWTNNIAKENGHCGQGRGTDYSHFKYVAKKMGYKTPITYVKDKTNGWRLPKSSYNNILRHLAEGDLVVVNVSKGHFTSGGHYMVLGGVDPETKKVYVYDPNNKYNSRYRKTGNGWWSFNDIIAPESKAFIIIEKG